MAKGERRLIARCMVVAISLAAIAAAPCAIGFSDAYAATEDLPVVEKEAERPMVGWVEKIGVAPGDLVMHAKLSPGTEMSSVSAQDIKEFRRGGKRWVRFKVADRYGKKHVAELPVIRTTDIKTHSDKASKRYVVELGLCLGTVYQEDEVTLVDRRKFEYEMLIGRNFLAGTVTIDPSVSYTVEPACNPGERSLASRSKSKKK